MRYPKTIKIGLNGVQVAPFGPKRCQNDAPDLRIIFPALLGPKTKLKNQKRLTIIKNHIVTVQNQQFYTQTPDFYIGIAKKFYKGFGREIGQL